MDAQQRRLEIARRLQLANAPISATALAQELSVSRQIIVGDVALLRAGGLEITATPRGYLLPKANCAMTCTFACRHRSDQMEEELNAMVDQGCTVLDVIVEHPVYGQLTAPIHVSNRYEVSQFIQRCRQSEAVPSPSSPRGFTCTQSPAGTSRAPTGSARSWKGWVSSTNKLKSPLPPGRGLFCYFSSASPSAQAGWETAALDFFREKTWLRLSMTE